MKTKTVLFDTWEREREIEEVLGYHYESLFMWAVVRCSDGATYTIPLHDLAIKSKLVADGF